MPNVDLTRVAGNIGALNSLNSLSYINNQLTIHQARLASGRRINEAADDPAGLVMATTFDARRESYKTVLKAIGDAKNVMSMAEGGMRKISEILTKMRGKALEALGSTIGTEERAAIKQQLDAFAAEIDAIVETTKWNQTSLLGTSGSAAPAGPGNLKFLTDVAGSQSTTTFGLTQGYGAYGSSGSGLALYTGSASDGFETSQYEQWVGKIDAAITKVKDGIGTIGAFSARLTFKEEQLSVAYTNTEGAYNRIMNANMAEEQVNASKFLILQQTATSMLAQANSAPQFLLSLFR